jgi:23S rRNA (adenine2503-C2)-methyltransferase
MRALLDMPREAFVDELAAMGEPKYRAAQVYKWLYLGAAFEDMTDLPAALRKKLRDNYSEGHIRTEECLVSADGTKKYLFSLADGLTVESVYMPRDYGVSVCVSTQVGCACGCVFCASCKDGLERDLSAGEMLAQVIAMNSGNVKKADHIVLMGMGEPLLNYANVVRFIEIANSEKGLDIGRRSISLSTCGIVEGIDRLAVSGLGVTLSVSLHAPSQRQREEIMPVAKGYGIDEVVGAAKRYFDATGRRIIFEYAMIDGVNDRTQDAEGLKRLLGDINCQINLIPLNDTGTLRATPKHKVYSFCERLGELGLSATVRRSSGGDVEGACGQLRQRRRNI